MAKKLGMPERLGVCVRAVIIQRRKILLCKIKNASWYFYPGGHVEFGETAEESLKREIKEELGIKVGHSRFMGTVENIFTEGGVKYHEIDLIFKVGLKGVAASQEDHIDFYWLDMFEFSQKLVHPRLLKKEILDWLKNKKTFFVTQR